MNRGIKISEICKTFGLTYEGNDIEIDGLNFCNRPSQYSKILTYVTSGEYVDIIKELFSIRYELGGKIYLYCLQMS